MALVRVSRAEQELSREIAAHLQLLEDRYVAEGMSREDARYAARRAFGGVEQAKELQRDARGFRGLASWPMDLRLGARMLVKSPGLTIIAVIALAVAFGGGATYLEFVNGLVTPSLSVPEGERLVGIVTRDLQQNRPERRVLADFRAWRDGATLIDHLGAAQALPGHGEIITDDGRGALVEGVRISASAFRLIPATPVLGRPLIDADEDPSAPPAAVIGERLWRSVFRRDPAVIGRWLRIGSERYTIAGVMPESFGFPVNHVLWVPLRDPAAAFERGSGPVIDVFGRLKEGATLEAASAELASLSATAGPATENARSTTVTVLPYVDSRIAALDLRQQVLALYAVNLVFVALLGVCAANVATLVFGRTVTRESEITVRTALGASRGRIVSQLFAEALVLTSAAAGVGLLAARMALGWVEAIWRQGNGVEMPFWWNASLDWQTFLYAAVLVLLASLIVGGVPALKATGRQLQARLKHAGAGSTMQFGGLWTSVIVTQVAITVVFLLSVIAMGWSVRGIVEEYEKVAFNRAHYMTAMLEATVGQETTAYIPPAGFIDRLRSSPAVQNVTYTTRLPAADQERTYFDIDGEVRAVRVAHIGPAFFDTFERRFIAGRDFATTELERGAGVAIADESFVRFALGGGPAVGRHVRVKDPNTGELGPWIEIIGVTADMSTSERKTIRDARLYRPIGAARGQDVYVIAHARPGYRHEGLGDIAATMREAGSSASAGRPLRAIGTLDSSGDGDVIEYVFAALAIIAGVALLLATAGVYALISFTLARRTREIGIRIALGASRRRIVTGVLSRALWQIGLGVVCGAIPGLLIAGSVASEMGRNGLAEGSAAAVAVAAFVLGVAAVSCAVPLRRALRIQPTEALRTN